MSSSPSRHVYMVISLAASIFSSARVLQCGWEMNFTRVVMNSSYNNDNVESGVLVACSLFHTLPSVTSRLACVTSFGARYRFNNSENATTGSELANSLNPASAGGMRTWPTA